MAGQVGDKTICSLLPTMSLLNYSVKIENTVLQKASYFNEISHITREVSEKKLLCTINYLSRMNLCLESLLEKFFRIIAVLSELVSRCRPFPSYQCRALIVTYHKNGTSKKQRISSQERI